MDFFELDDTDLLTIQQELEEQVRASNLPLGEVSVIRSRDSEHLEATALVLSDPILASPEDATDRRIRITIIMFIMSQETERAVLWGGITFSVKREQSNFFPVPEDYGDDVSIRFNWEFDRETLEPGAAEVRDRSSVHYASVLPNQQLTGFVQCCSIVAERWAS